MEKICKKHNITKILYPLKNGITQFYCKECKRESNYRNREKIKEYQKQYQIDNREEIKENSKLYYIENREEILENKKQYHIENKEERNEYSKQYHAEHKEEKREYNKQYRIENKEEIREYNKQYGINNKEEIKEYKKQYWFKHKEEKREYDKLYCTENKDKRNEYQKNRNKTDPAFKLRINISNSINKFLHKSGSSKNGSSILKHLLYTIEELKNYIELLFEPWMSWENHSKYNIKTWDENDQLTWTWNLDHIIPQTHLPYTSMEDDNFKICWALENLRPYNAKKNIEEGNNRSQEEIAKIKNSIKEYINILIMCGNK